MLTGGYFRVEFLDCCADRRIQARLRCRRWLPRRDKADGWMRTRERGVGDTKRSLGAAEQPSSRLQRITPVPSKASPTSYLRAMDPLSVTASVIAVATAALQSAKALYDVVDGLVDAPRSVSQSQSLLSQTQTTLGTLTRTLKSNSAAGAVDSVLKEIEVGKALKSTDSLCQEFTTTITKFTSHSTDSRFSTRDRFIVQFNESKINRLNRDLADCQRTITMVLSSVTLYGPRQ